MKSEHEKFGNRLYFMNDKNIRDGLVAQRVKTSHLSKFLIDKGVLVPKDGSKETLLNMLKTFRFDYFDYVYLSSILENPDRRDSESTIEIPETISRGDINLAVTAVKTECAKDEVGISMEMIGKKAVLDINYVDTDYSKAPMRQRTQKKGTIEIEFSEEGETSIRFPATEVGKKIKEKLINQLRQTLKNIPAPIEIDFEHSTPKLRTDFFTKLISLPNYDVYDVVNVSVRNSRGDSDEDEPDLTGHVRKAALSGISLLTSDIYKSFPSEDYNIYKIVWKIRKIENASGSNQSDCFTVEAKFDDAVKSKGFSYQVKLVQRYNSSRSDLNTSTDKPDKNQVETLSKLIFKTAAAIYTELTSEA
jgi:hypothetical protein